MAHKPSDLVSVGDAGSQAAAIAKDMLHLADTKILHGQDQAVADELRVLLGLPDIAVDIVTDWCRQAPGRALWIVGEQLFKVLTVLAPVEKRAGLDELRAGIGWSAMKWGLGGAGARPGRVRRGPDRDPHHGHGRRRPGGRRTDPARPLQRLHRPDTGGSARRDHRGVRPAEVGDAALPVADQPRPADPGPDQGAVRGRAATGTGCRGNCWPGSGWPRPGTAATTTPAPPARRG